MAKTSKRKLKTYQTSLGFYDQAIAAPSMKAALEAWGASSNLFHQGIAQETDDPDVVAATLAKPGVVLRRPVGSDGRFTESAELPTDLGEGDARPRRKPRKPPAKKPAAKKPAAKKPPAKTAKKRSREVDDAAARKAAAAFEKEERRREEQRRKEEAARAKARERRDKAVAAAQAALDKARREHEAKIEEIEAERAALDTRAEAEQDRWDKQRFKLEQALRRAHD